MVVMCCRFLCYFCRTSGQNQRAMFEHLSYLLDNSSMLLGRFEVRFIEIMRLVSYKRHIWYIRHFLLDFFYLWYDSIVWESINDHDILIFSILTARPSLRGSCPLDVAYSSLMDNNELALALRESHLEKIAMYLSRCGLQSNSELLEKGYPDIGWDPVEGERYLDFFRFCVWVNGKHISAWTHKML